MAGIPDKGELKRWMSTGKSNRECLEMYRRKGLPASEVPSRSAVAMFRHRHKEHLPVGRPTYTALLPWTIKDRHKDYWAAKMLRAEARRRGGETLPPSLERRLDSWLRRLERDQAVVHYDPQTDDGFHYVDRRPGIDKDLIREPHLSDDGNSLS